MADLSDLARFVKICSKSALFLFGWGGGVEGELLFLVVPSTPMIFNLTFPLFAVFY